MSNVEAESSTNPLNDASNNILNQLNDDFVHRIFSFLEMVDLLEITKVCRRFNKIANEVFEAKHANFEGFRGEIIMHYWPFKDILNTFGRSIKSFGPAVLNDVHCELAVKHCPNVKELKCSVRDQQTVDQLRPLIVRLDKLDIHLTDASISIEDWFGADIQLKKLSIEHSNTYFRLPKGNLPELVELKMKSVRLGGGSEIFFRENPQLRRLSMSGWTEGKRPFDYSCFGLLKQLQIIELNKKGGNCDENLVLSAMREHGISVEDLLDNRQV